MEPSDNQSEKLITEPTQPQQQQIIQAQQKQQLQAQQQQLQPQSQPSTSFTIFVWRCFSVISWIFLIIIFLEV